MNKIVFCVFVLLASVFVLGDSVKAAEAGTISGTVTIGGVGANAAKVTAETVSTNPAIGYVTTTTGSSGTWSMSVSNSLFYTVDGMRSDATHGRVSNVNGNGQSNVNHSLSSRGLEDVIFKITADEEFRGNYVDWKGTAINKLNAAEPWFKTEHAIDFVMISSTLFYSWDSNDSPVGCGANPPNPSSYMLDEAKSESGWTSGTYNGADILVVFTGQDIPAGYQACADKPDSGHLHPGMITEDHAGDLTRTVMHELTHNYGFAHDTSCNYEPSIMLTPSVQCTNYIKNWRPAHDDTIESTRRGWY